MELQLETYIETLEEHLDFIKLMKRGGFTDIGKFYDHLGNLVKWPFTKKVTIHIYDDERFELIKKSVDTSVFIKEIEKGRVYIFGGNIDETTLTYAKFKENLIPYLEGLNLNLL